MYETVTRFAQSWGMYYAFAIFAVVLAYALWPSNKAEFDHAARAPLESEDDHDH